MQKLFFTVLLVVAVLVTIRLYRQKEAETAAQTAVEEILSFKEEVAAPAADPAEPSAEFEEEHPEITSGDEETLIEE